jgi:ribosomal protein L34E
MRPISYGGHDGVFWRKLMAISTMGLKSAPAIVAALFNRIVHVVGLRPDKNMVGIYTKRSIAAMECLECAVEVESVEKMRHNAVNEASFVFEPPDRVATIVNSAPNPAAICVNDEGVNVLHSLDYKGERPFRHYF